MINQRLFRAPVVATLTASLATIPAIADYVRIDLSPFANARIQTYQSCAATYPEGDVLLGGVPFSIQNVGGNNAWNAQNAGGPHPRELEIPIYAKHAVEVHTLINTFYGQNGPESYITLEFFGSNGAYFVKELIGNEDVRDHFQSGWTNEINGTTTTEVFLNGRCRLDKQRIVLPTGFACQSLTHILLTSWGGTSISEASIQGLTIVTDPTAGISGDLDADGRVDFNDLTLLLAHFGESEGADVESGDFDRNGNVNLSDLAQLLANFGTHCE